MIIKAQDNNIKHIINEEIASVIKSKKILNTHETILMNYLLQSPFDDALTSYTIPSLMNYQPNIKFSYIVNNKEHLHFSYKRYLENQLRENFDLMGTPINLIFKNKNEK